MCKINFEIIKLINIFHNFCLSEYRKILLPIKRADLKFHSVKK